MPLVSVHDVLTHATENHYGVAAINVANYETIKWAVAAANQERVPLIIQFWPGFDPLYRYGTYCLHRKAVCPGERSADRRSSGSFLEL